MNDCTLPSSSAVCDLYDAPSLKTAMTVLGTVVGRGAILWGGFSLAGDTPKQALKHAAVGVVSIELFVLGWVAWQKWGRK